MTKTTKIRLGIGLVVVVALGTGWYVNRDKTDVDDLRAGDCIQTMPEVLEEFSNVTTVPCNEPHEGEITGILSDEDVGGVALNAQIKCVEVSQSYATSDVGTESIFAITIRGNDGEIEGATCGIRTPSTANTSFADS